MTASRLLRLALAGGALLLATLASVAENGRRAEVRDALRVWESFGIAARHPEATREIERETDPRAARLRMSRAILSDALHARWLRDLSPAEMEQAARSLPAHLARAESWAAATLSTRPLSWEAAQVIGGARFLAAWRDPDDTLYDNVSSWREPLEAARRLAPAEPEPTRLLAAATLVSWPGLSDHEREEATDLLRSAFSDPGTLAVLLADWRAAAPSDEAFEALLPDRRSTWSLLSDTYAREGRWDAYCRARPMWWSRVLDESRALLVEAARQRDQGDPRRARATLLRVLETLPVDGRTLPLAERILDLLPPGPVGARSLPRLEAWLRWGLPLALRDLPTLSPRAFGRLASLGGDRLPRELETWAWLESGDLRLAVESEARSDRRWSEEWGPYFLAKASRLLETGTEEEAKEAFSAVHDSWVGGWTGQSLAYELGLRETPPRTSERWSGVGWRWRGPLASLEIALGVRAEGLRIVVDDPGSPAAALLGSVDGREETCAPVHDGSRVRVATRLAPGVHLVGVQSAAPGRLVPGDVAALVSP